MFDCESTLHKDDVCKTSPAGGCHRAKVRNGDVLFSYFIQASLCIHALTLVVEWPAVKYWSKLGRHQIINQVVSLKVQGYLPAFGTFLTLFDLDRICNSGPRSFGVPAFDGPRLK